MRKLLRLDIVLTALVICTSAGCVVPQPPGKGRLSLLREKTTKRHYWLYLPEEFMGQFSRGVARPVHPVTENGLWPLVVSFHGMKPFDNCLPQAQEWQQESDRYGFIMIAPQLMTSDLFMEFPLRRSSHGYVQGDERASPAIMHEVSSNFPIDRKRVLSTSWSSGGYLAHYMVNRYPTLFSCLAVRQSNFSADLLNTRQVKSYRHMPVGVFWTQNDFAICKSESRKAVQWYRSHGFRDFSWGVFGGMGHERTPQSAAALFAIQCKIKPKTPAKFARVVEAHGRMGQAVAYARRAVPRPSVPVAGRTDELAGTTIARGPERNASGPPNIRSGQRKPAGRSTPPTKTKARPGERQPAPLPSNPPKAPTQVARPATPSKTLAYGAPSRSGPAKPKTQTPPAKTVASETSPRPAAARPKAPKPPAKPRKYESLPRVPAPAPKAPKPTDGLKYKAPSNPSKEKGSSPGEPVLARSGNEGSSANYTPRSTAAPRSDRREKWAKRPTGSGGQRGGTRASYTPAPNAPDRKQTQKRTLPAPQRTESVREASTPPPKPSAVKPQNVPARQPNATKARPAVGGPLAKAPSRSTPVKSSRGSTPPKRSTAQPAPSPKAPRKQALPPRAIARAEPRPPSRTVNRPRAGVKPAARSTRRAEVPAASPKRPTEAAKIISARKRAKAGLVEVRLTTSVGKSPCYVGFKAVPPSGVAGRAKYVWKVDGTAICNSETGETVITEPGAHRIEVVIMAPDGREYSGCGVVTVVGKSRRKRPTRDYGISG